MRSSCNGRGTASISATLHHRGRTNIWRAGTYREAENRLLTTMWVTAWVARGVYCERQGLQTKPSRVLENNCGEGPSAACRQEQKRSNMYHCTYFGRWSSGTGLRSSRSLGPRSRTKSIQFGADFLSFRLPGISGGGLPSGGSIGSLHLMEASSILHTKQESGCPRDRSESDRVISGREGALLATGGLERHEHGRAGGSP